MPFFIPPTACALTVWNVGAFQRTPSMIMPVTRKTSAHNAPCDRSVASTAASGLKTAGSPAAKAPEPKSATPDATMAEAAASKRMMMAFWGCYGIAFAAVCKQNWVL